MSSRRLQDVLNVIIFLSSKTSSRGLQDVFARRLQDVFKMSWKTKNCYTQDVLRTSLSRLENQQMFVRFLLPSFLYFFKNSGTGVFLFLQNTSSDCFCTMLLFESQKYISIVIARKRDWYWYCSKINDNGGKDSHFLTYDTYDIWRRYMNLNSI